MFLFDIGSDIYNGITFINEGNPIWGLIILGVVLIPMAVFYVGFAILKYRDEESSQRKTLLILLFGPILPAIYIYHDEDSSRCDQLLSLLFASILAVIYLPVATVVYVSYVAYVFARRCIEPGYDDKDENNVSQAGDFKLMEAVCEANLQAVLGWFTSLFTI